MPVLRPELEVLEARRDVPEGSAGVDRRCVALAAQHRRLTGAAAGLRQRRFALRLDLALRRVPQEREMFHAEHELADQAG